MADYSISMGVSPDVAERVVGMHGAYYGAHWGFGTDFAEKVASELARFIDAYEPERDGLWAARVDGHIEGSIAIDGSRARYDGAHLRWFIVSDRLRGAGAGSQLLRTALAFCEERGYSSVHLWTFEGLDAARRLYDREGFVLTEQATGVRWGTEVMEQRFERIMR